jgi:G2/mitotic-specific cyclin 2
MPPVSILTRQWAKKAAPHFGITDAHKSLDQITARDDYDDYE